MDLVLVSHYRFTFLNMDVDETVATSLYKVLQQQLQQMAPVLDTAKTNQLPSPPKTLTPFTSSQPTEASHRLTPASEIESSNQMYFIIIAGCSEYHFKLILLIYIMILRCSSCKFSCCLILLNVLFSREWVGSETQLQSPAGKSFLWNLFCPWQHIRQRNSGSPKILQSCLTSLKSFK